MRRNYKFVKFEEKHIEDASKLAFECYLEECSHVPELPEDAKMQELKEYADNELGIAAFENERLVGFLCCMTPWDNFFGTSKGTYVPVDAHGSILEDRKRIYSRLYEVAADVWVKNGILSHAIGVYSHDQDVINSFFWNGFGMRTIEAVRMMETISNKQSQSNIVFKELEKERYAEIHPLRNGIVSHLNKSPMFMPHKQASESQFIKYISESDRRYFVAEDLGEVIAYIKLTEGGESFVGDHESMINIQGAFMKAEYRGSNIYTDLLVYMITQLKNEKHTRLGVDCESFNPTARGFWLKYFTPYIFGLTRRIDERISTFYE
ncbi:MAG: GNAT family N-acetyltransferase [Clostridiales bacterium]|nr:GNAT family N-acetyltransferase [Clostridiales bacterium]